MTIYNQLQRHDGVSLSEAAAASGSETVEAFAENAAASDLPESEAPSERP